MKKLLCCGCKSRFEADTLINLNGSNFHSIECASEYATKKARKLKDQQVKQEDKAHNKRKRELKDNDRKFQIEKTQAIFNKFIRYRDRNLPCVSCGRDDDEISYSGTGGKWDCGHYKTRGAYPELRFHPLNAAKQCKKCNGGSGKYSRKGRTVNEGYDIGLLERVGQECFDWLNGPHEPAKFTFPELKELQQHYKELTKEIESND